MDATNGSVWLALAIVLIIGVITKALIRRNVPAPVCNRLPPPVANNGSIVMLLHAFLTKGFHAMIQDQYTKLGSVFTVSIFGLKATFLVGPEVLGQFFEGMPSEIAVSPAIQFFEPILGKETYGIDTTTHYWLTGFMKDALKSGKLRSMVSPMIQEVEVMPILLYSSSFVIWLGAMQSIIHLRRSSRFLVYFSCGYNHLNTWILVLL
jgi:sterol 14-demethylase